MQNKTKIIVIIGIVVALLAALLLTLSLRKNSATTSLPQKNQTKVALSEKLDSPDLGLGIGYPKGFKVAKSDSENFTLIDESSPAVRVSVQKIKKQATGAGSFDIYSLTDSFKKSFLKIDKDCQFFNETKFIKTQNNGVDKFPGMGFEAQYSLSSTRIKYFLAVIQKGNDFYVFSLSSPLADYPNKIGVMTSMLGSLNLK